MSHSCCSTVAWSFKTIWLDIDTADFLSFPDMGFQMVERGGCTAKPIKAAAQNGVWLQIALAISDQINVEERRALASVSATYSRSRA